MDTFNFYNVLNGELLDSKQFNSFEDADKYCEKYELAYSWKVI